MKLNDFKKELDILMDNAALLLSAEEYDQFIEYIKEGVY